MILLSLYMAKYDVLCKCMLHYKQINYYSVCLILKITVTRVLAVFLWPFHSPKFSWDIPFIWFTWQTRSAVSTTTHPHKHYTHSSTSRRPCSWLTSACWLAEWLWMACEMVRMRERKNKREKRENEISSLTRCINSDEVQHEGNESKHPITARDEQTLWTEQWPWRGEDMLFNIDTYRITVILIMSCNL